MTSPAERYGCDMRKFILAAVGLAGVGVGIYAIYGWPWASIVVGGVIFADTILPEPKP